MSTVVTSSDPESFFRYYSTHFHTSFPGDIRWSHAVNSQEKLGRVLQDPSVMVVEVDVRIAADGTLIAAHPPAVESDLQIKDVLHAVHKTTKGLKLDFKDAEAVVPTLALLNVTQMVQPVLLNADILQGNGAPESKFHPSEFIESCLRLYSRGFLSLGWTTVADSNFPYTQENIDEMTRVCVGLKWVTLPVRACLLPNSWEVLQKFTQSEGYYMTIWNNEPVDSELQKWIIKNTNPEKTMYDFIDKNKDPLRLF